MVRHFLLLSAALGWSCVQATPLVTPQEAALPAAGVGLATRGISRGPSIRVLSPLADVAVKSPFDFKLSFEGRGGEKVDPSSVKVTYLKASPIDLTPRLLGAIGAAGIDMPQAELPPGEHAFRVTVKDAAGRESHLLLSIAVQK